MHLLYHSYVSSGLRAFQRSLAQFFFMSIWQVFVLGSGFDGQVSKQAQICHGCMDGPKAVSSMKQYKCITGPAAQHRFL